MSIQQDIQQFLSQKTFAVAGASSRRDKYGNKVLRCYMQHGKKTYPVHPLEKEIETLKAYTKLADIPEKIDALSLITNPAVTEKIVVEAHQLGIKYIWMQPGAESKAAIEFCEKNGITIIAEGPCVLVSLGFHDAWEPGQPVS